MAKNRPIGDNSRKGAVKRRKQVFNGKINKWIKINENTGKFMDIKQDGTPFKGVRKYITNS